MSLLEWLKFWSKFLRIPLFCSTEYPPPPKKMKIVRESKSECPRIPPQCKLSEIPNPRVSEYPPKIVRDSKSESFRIAPQWKLSESKSESGKLSESKSESFRIPPQWKLSGSPNPRVSEYPPKMKIVRESKSESFRIPLPPKSEKLQISNFRIVLQPGRSYVETNL